MKRTKKDHKNKIYSDQRSRKFMPQSYSSVYYALYSIDDREEINKLIKANEFLLDQTISMDVKDFRRIYNSQRGYCAVTGYKLEPVRVVNHWDEKYALGIGIKPTSKNSSSYELVVYPYACSWYQQRKALVGVINPTYSNEYPISYPVFMHIIEKIKESPIMKHPIEISISEEITRNLFSVKSSNLAIYAFTTLSDKVSRHTDDGLFKVTITNDIEITSSTEMNKTIVPLADPSIDFIDETLNVLHTSVINGIRVLIQRFYEGNMTTFAKG